MVLRFLVVFLRFAVVALLFYWVWKVVLLVFLKSDILLVGNMLRLGVLGVVLGEKFVHQVLKIKLVPPG